MSEDGFSLSPPRERLSLPNVTLCAVSSSNVAATIEAMEASLAQASFGEAILFTDADTRAIRAVMHPDLRVVRIDRIGSSAAYSQFVLTQMVDHVRTSHCLIVQWDGHVIDGGRWQQEFLDYDYIGARWPQFDDGRDVGNGGFSLRSRRLMEACRAPEFAPHHPEDLAICRTNRGLLEGMGLRFAPAALADRFSAERAGDPATSFGYHGVFLMPRVLGADRFWRIYRTLDERSSLWRDFSDIVKALRSGPSPALRSLRMAANRVIDFAFSHTR